MAQKHTEKRKIDKRKPQSVTTKPPFSICLQLGDYNSFKSVYQQAREQYQQQLQRSNKNQSFSQSGFYYLPSESHAKRIVQTSIQPKNPKPKKPSPKRAKSKHSVRISLNRLSLMIKAYLQQYQQASNQDLYNAIALKYLGKNWSSSQFFVPLKRRICEVLRVFAGVCIIYPQLNGVSMTDFGRLRGKADCQKLNQSRRKCSLLKKKVTQLQEKKKRLSDMLNAFKALQLRNKKEISQRQLSKSTESSMKILLPLGGITTCSGNWLFKQTMKVEVDEQSGRCVVSGDELRIVRLEDMLFALNPR